jgi:hypothetical protein
MRLQGIVPLVLAALLLAVAPASAAKLQGKTGHGLRVTVTTDKAGAAKRVVIHWWVRRCDRGRYRFDHATLVRPTKGSKPVPHVSSSNPYWVRARGGFRERIAARVQGRRRSIFSWEGTFSAVATIKRHGRVLDRCHFHRQHWRASIPQVRLDLSGDQYDYVMKGNTMSFASPGDPFYVEGNSHGAVIDFYDYSVVVRAPDGHRLKPRRYRGARKALYAADHPGLELSGDGAACDSVTGEFTLTHARFDREGIVWLSGSFIQHCNGAGPAARGTFSYRR